MSKRKSKTKAKEPIETVEPTEPTDDNDNSEKNEVEDNEADSKVPDLEYVSDTRKERYEYRPIIRNEIVYRLPEDRVTSEVMTKFELCEVISIRAKQLEQGKVVFTDVGDLTDPLEIAKKEILDKKCPLSIVRMITDKIAEKWKVNEMAIPYDAL